MLDKHLMKLRARDDISAEEEQAIRSAVSIVCEYPGDYTFARAGERLAHSTIILDGLACRYKDLSNGQRQISELHVGGDFADLHSFTLKYLDHSLMTLAPCRVAKVPHERLEAITREHPHLTRVFWFSTNLDAAIHREWVLSLGQRSAVQRAAHLFCELRVRLGIVGLADDSGYDLEITQAELSEYLGLTVVHVNRTLRRLRELGLVEFRRNRVELLDFGGLQSLAEFDPLYLYLDKRPR
jgi:CRP-like cAMP-binding protein